jgi:hypothetical protein
VGDRCRAHDDLHEEWVGHPTMTAGKAARNSTFGGGRSAYAVTRMGNPSRSP